MPDQWKMPQGFSTPFGLSQSYSPANPNDPSQLRNWGLDAARTNQNQSWAQNLFDPATLQQLQSFFGPYFNQQQSSYASNFNNQLNNQVGQAQNQAGAYAAFKGLNPSSYVQNAGQGVRSKMTPSFTSGYSDLLGNQGNTLFNATAQTNQYRNRNAQDYAKMLMNGSSQAQETWDQPGFFDYLLGSIFGSAGELGGAAINKWG